ncbi:hypothetical protein [Algibacter sp. PT7-4]|uniref:hypothetical protein n=1 Tax=Algibacter ulvanivorans TaxID=3400999 RepID=UPI003AADE3F8
MAIDVETIGGSSCTEVSGAFSHTELYVALLEDFETLTEPKERCGNEAAATLEELVTITADHAFKTGKGFTKIKCIADTVGLESNQIGDVTKSPAIENKLSVQILGSTPEILGYKRLIKGRDLIVLAPEFGSGQVRQIGSAKYPTRMGELSSKIEPTVEGENTSSMVFMDKQRYDAPIYKGAITLQPESI